MYCIGGFMMRDLEVVVVGSINMDLVSTTERFPKIGETVIGNSFMQRPGGKGANQAVSASRLGANVTMIGSVGDDVFGQELISVLNAENIDTECIQIIDEVPSGVAQITLTKADNHIIVVPGANNKSSPLLIRRHEEVIKNADILLLQLEIPTNTVEETIYIANKHDIPIVLNPAPARDLTYDLLSKVNYLIPNETELNLLGKQHYSLEQNINYLIESGVKNVVLTLGAEGVLYRSQNSNVVQHQYANKIAVKDTTGAGDAFVAGFSLAIAEQKSIHEAITFANAVGALAVNKLGSLQAMPYRSRVEEIIPVKNKNQV